jgi:hypothetical protein
MKIISKRQAMALYRQHPGSRLANINGLAVSAIMLAGKFRTYAAFWPCLLNVVRTAMVLMSFFEVSLSINPSFNQEQ